MLLTMMTVMSRLPTKNLHFSQKSSLLVGNRVHVTEFLSAGEGVIIGHDSVCPVDDEVDRFFPFSQEEALRLSKTRA
jgi:hypothetical protein